jgi:LysM repeat protein
MMQRPLKRTPSKQASNRRLRATAQRAAAKYAPDEHEVEEPNVKLSRAFVVVLLLHVVAVGGIFAFSALKDRQQAGGMASRGRSGEGRESLQANAAATTNQTELTPAVNSTHRVKPGETLASIATAHGLAPHDLELANNLKPGAALTPGKELVVPEKAALRPVPLNVQKLVETPKAASSPKAGSNNAGPDKGGAGLDKEAEDGSRSYIVQRGDTPALIAKRLKVSAAELLKLNNIQDPRKLQVGQKLVVP